MRVNKQSSKSVRMAMHDFERRSVALFTTVLVGMMIAHAPHARGQQAHSAQPQPVQDRIARMRLSSAQVQQAFERMDVDKDGRLTRAETKAFPRVERVFERMDTNGDGTVSPGEFEEAVQQAT